MTETDPIADTTPATVPPTGTWTVWEAEHAWLLRKITIYLLLFGFFWRIFRYLMAMPVWGDEAMLLVNYFTRDYGDIFGPIEYCQIAPLTFHWAEITMLKLFGPSEWSVRLPPLLGSVVGLGLFCLLARLALSPLPRMFAIGILSVAIWPATTGSLVKPYSWDLLFSVVLLIPFAAWRRQRERSWPLVVLCLVSPLAMASSYTAVFVAGAIGMAMAPRIFRRTRLSPVAQVSNLSDSRAQVGNLSYQSGQIALLFLYTAIVCGSFLAHYQFVGKVHLSSKTYGISTADGMGEYWQGAFPPSNPLKLLYWIPMTLAGEIAAYPAGAQRGGSILTATLAVFGGIGFWKRGEREWVWIFAAMLVLWFVAAAMHKYPMGSCRLGQHAGPLFCLFIGAGFAEVLRRYLPVRRAKFAVIGLGLLLGAIGLGGLGRDLVRPYRDLDARDSRIAVRAITETTSDPILIAQKEGEIGIAPVHWYLGATGSRVQWVGLGDWSDAVRDKPSLWVVVCLGLTEEDEESKFLSKLFAAGGKWMCTMRYVGTVTAKGRPEEQTLRGYLFVRQP